MHRPLSANHTGIQVVVVGPAKSGTRTMIHALNDIGIRAYHSEDLLMGPLWEYSQHELAFRANAGEQQESLAEVLGSDPKGGEMLAQALSRCQVGAMSFDGLEALEETLLRLSP